MKSFFRADGGDGVSAIAEAPGQHRDYEGDRLDSLNRPEGTIETIHGAVHEPDHFEYAPTRETFILPSETI
jgi:hypothetical protein